MIHRYTRLSREIRPVSILIFLACGSSDGVLRGPAPATGMVVTIQAPLETPTASRDTGPSSDPPLPVDSGTDVGTTADTGSTSSCLPGMVLVDNRFCIDRWEAHLVDQSPYEVPTAGVAATAAGAVPQGYISGEVAEFACSAAGKHLCSSEEWLRACQGSSGHTYPYGPTHDPSACNDSRAVHPIVELFGDAADWSPEQMNDARLNQLPDSLAPSGSHPDCVTLDGVYDLHGNLHEWVSDADGTFRGGFYVDAVINGPGCTYRTTAHTRPYHDYSTGFRCCKAPS